MDDILDYTHYKDEMTKSIMDKLFFLDKIDASIFVDYGCADGTLFETIQKLFHKERYTYFGYDIDPAMIKAAWNKQIQGSFWSTHLDKLMPLVNTEKVLTGGKTALILSSIIHEIYSYLDLNGINRFWEFVFESDFDYIIIRDMAISNPVPINHFQYMAWEKAIFAKENLRNLSSDFQRFWGDYSSSNGLENIIHFLLKYRYPQNWERELKEDYLSLSSQEYRNIIYNHNKEYNTTYHEHFVHPWIAKQIEKDFGIPFYVKTHVKYILEKKEII